MIKTMTLTPGQEPTPEQIAEVEAARSRPIVYDEDSPKLTPRAIQDFQRAAALRDARKREGSDASRETRLG